MVKKQVFEQELKMVEKCRNINNFENGIVHYRCWTCFSPQNNLTHWSDQRS